MSSKIAEKPIVYIYPRAYHLMSLWSKLGGDKGQEFTCLGRAQLGSTGNVFVTDAWLVKHEGNAGSVEADDDDINELIFDLYEKGIEPQELRVWVHSHPGTGQSATYLSGTDESNISRFMTGEWLISIVFDSAGENPYTRIDFKNPRAKIVADLEVHYFLSAEDTEWAKKMFEEKATKKTSSVSYPSQHRGSSSTPAYQSWGSGYQGGRGSQSGGKGSGKGSGKGGSSSSSGQAGASWERNQSKSQKKAEKKAERKAQNRMNRETAALAIASAPPQAGQKGSTSGSNTAAKAEKKEGDQSHRSSIVPYAWAKNDAPSDMGADYYTGLDEDYADWDWNVDGGRSVGPHSMTKREVHELALNCVVYLDSIGMRVLENDITIEEGVEEIIELGFTQADAEDQLDQRTGGSGTTRAEQKVNDAEIEEMEMGPVERMEAHLREGISGARAVPSYESLAYEGDDGGYPMEAVVPWYDRVAADDKEDDIDAAETREMFLNAESERTVEEGTQEVIGFEYPVPEKDEAADDAVAEAWEQMSSAKREEALERWEEETTEFFKEAEDSKDAREEAEFEADLKAEEEAAARLDELVMAVLEVMEDELNAWEVEQERANPYFDHAAINKLAWDAVSKEWDPVYVSFWRSRGHDDAKSNALVKAWKGLTDLFDGRSFRERNDDALRIARHWLYDDAGVEYAHGKAVGEEVVDPVGDASSDEFPEVVTPSQLAAEASQVLIDDDEKISQEAGRMWIVPRRPEEKEKEKSETWDTPWGTAQRIASHTDRFSADVHKQMRETPGAIEAAKAGTLSAKRLADLVLEDEVAQAHRKYEAEQHQDSLDAAEAVVAAVDANPDPQEAFAAGQRAYSTATDPQYVAQTIAARMDRKTDDILERMRATPGAIDEAQAGTLTALRLIDLEDDHTRRCKLFAENGPGGVPAVVADAVPTPIPVDDTEKMLSKTEPTIEVIDLTDEVNEVADEV